MLKQDWRIRRRLFNHCGAAIVLLSILRKCGKINTIEANHKHGVYSLAMAYSKLRLMGYKVSKRTITFNGKETTEYFMRKHGKN